MAAAYATSHHTQNHQSYRDDLGTLVCRRKLRNTPCPPGIILPPLHHISNHVLIIKESYYSHIFLFLQCNSLFKILQITLWYYCRGWWSNHPLQGLLSFHPILRLGSRIWLTSFMPGGSYMASINLASVNLAQR